LQIKNDFNWPFYLSLSLSLSLFETETCQTAAGNHPSLGLLILPCWRVGQAHD
jgi:hypothetical protein